MNISENSQYNSEAADLLHSRLARCEWKVDESTGAIEKAELVTMFRHACDVLHSGEERSRHFLVADALSASCIRVVRCLCLGSDASYILIRDQVYPLDALDQYRNAVRNYEHLLSLVKR